MGQENEANKENDISFHFRHELDSKIIVISLHLCIRFVRGSISFFPNRGSSGVSAPNCETDTNAMANNQ